MWRLLIIVLLWLNIFGLRAEDLCSEQHPCEVAAEQDLEWDISLSPLEPYFWLANTSADATLAGNDLPIDLKFFEHAVDNMGDGIQLRIELHLFAVKNNWSVIIDPTRLRADSTQEFRGNTFTTDSTFKMSDAKVGYQFIEGLDLFVGARYTSQNLRMSSAALPTNLKGSHHWWSLVVGLRYRHELTDKWNLSCGVYFGGLQRGSNNDHSTSGNLLLTYDYGDWFDVSLGYRVLHLSMSTGQGPTLFSYEATYSGPMLGVNIDFF